MNTLSPECVPLYGISNENWLGYGCTLSPQLLPVYSTHEVQNTSTENQHSYAVQDFQESDCLPATDLLGNPVLFQQVEMDSSLPWIPIGRSLNNLRNIVTMNEGFCASPTTHICITNPVPTFFQSLTGDSNIMKQCESEIQIEDPSLSHIAGPSTMWSMNIPESSVLPVLPDSTGVQDTGIDFLDEDPLIFYLCTTEEGTVVNPDTRSEPDTVDVSVNCFYKAESPEDVPGRQRDVVMPSFEPTEESSTDNDLELPGDITKFTTQLTASCQMALKSVDPEDETEPASTEQTTANERSACHNVSNAVFNVAVTKADRAVMRTVDAHNFRNMMVDWFYDRRSGSFRNMAQTSNILVGPSSNVLPNLENIVKIEYISDPSQIVNKMPPPLLSVFEDMESVPGMDKPQPFDTAAKMLSATKGVLTSVSVPEHVKAVMEMKPIQSFDSYLDELSDEFQRESSSTSLDDRKVILDGIAKLRPSKREKVNADAAESSIPYHRARRHRNNGKAEDTRSEMTCTREKRKCDDRHAQGTNPPCKVFKISNRKRTSDYPDD